MRYIFVSSILAGVFAGIYLETGQNVDPESLAIETGDTVAKELGDSLWSSIRPLLILASAFFTSISILLILLKGLPGILAAVGGYLGAMLMVTSIAPIFGVFLLLIGGIVSTIWSG